MNSFKKKIIYLSLASERWRWSVSTSTKASNISLTRAFSASAAA